MTVQTASETLPKDAAPSVIHFPEGLPGFDRALHWELIQNDDARPFLWLRALEGPPVSLLLIDPREVIADYQVMFSRHELARVGLAPTDPKVVFGIVTLRADGPTVNLKAPLVFNPGRMLGTQVILEDAQWPLRHPLIAGRS